MVAGDEVLKGEASEVGKGGGWDEESGKGRKVEWERKEGGVGKEGRWSGKGRKVEWERKEGGVGTAR